MEISAYQEVYNELNTVSASMDFKERCAESQTGEYIIVDDTFKVRINTIHPEFTAVVIESMLNGEVKLYEKVDASKLEHCRGCGNQSPLLRRD